MINKDKISIKKKVQVKKDYYRYMGYSDGSGMPHGLIIKCYTKEQVERFTKMGSLVFVKMAESKGDE